MLADDPLAIALTDAIRAQDAAALRRLLGARPEVASAPDEGPGRGEARTPLHY